MHSEREGKRVSASFNIRLPRVIGWLLDRRERDRRALSETKRREATESVVSFAYQSGKKAQKRRCHVTTQIPTPLRKI